MMGQKGSCTLEVVTLRPQSSKDEANHARKQVIKMLILVVILFFVCWGPRLTMEVLQKYGLVPFNNLIYRMRMTFNIMTFFHGCINPFIYCFMSKNFRARFFKFLEVCGYRPKADGRTSDVHLVPILSQRTHSGHSTKKPEVPHVSKLKQEGKCSLFGSETKQTDAESVVCVNAGQCDYGTNDSFS